MDTSELVDSDNRIINKDELSLFCQIIEDFKTPKLKDPAYNNFIGLFFNYPGLIAIIHHRIAYRLYRRGFHTLGRVIMGITQFISNIDLHPGAFIGRRVFIDHGIGVVIGETAEIGNDVTIYQGVSLGGVSLEKMKRHPTVLDGAIIGAGAKVLGNIIIGIGAKVGSNSVVIRDVPNYLTAVGIPARVIRSKTSSEEKEIKDTNSNLENKKITTKLPDINKQMFEYILCRLGTFENFIKKKNVSIKQPCKHYKRYRKDQEKLDKIYQEFLKSLK